MMKNRGSSLMSLDTFLSFFFSRSGRRYHCHVVFCTVKRWRLDRYQSKEKRVRKSEILTFKYYIFYCSRVERCRHAQVNCEYVHIGPLSNGKLLC
jgi:hypothetical protein